MNIEKEIEDRSGGKCELCSAQGNLEVFMVAPATEQAVENCIMACNTCVEQMEDPEKADPNHWRCLNDSMWSTVPAVQVMAWRMLNKLRPEGWPVDLLDMLYLDDKTLAWAKSAGEPESQSGEAKHVDSNGVLLETGDTVVLIKDLNVKGASFTAKRGTAVRRISLVADNPEHIEGKVNRQQIVILTKFVKKSN